MTRSGIMTVLERMNTLQRMRNKYEDKSNELYQNGETERSVKMDHKVDLYDREIDWMKFVLRKLGLDVWFSGERNEYVIPDDDIRRAI